MNIKQEQLKKHIKSINKKSRTIMLVLLLIATLVNFININESWNLTINHVIFLMILVHIIDSDLKQKAIIRFITDSVSDD